MAVIRTPAPSSWLEAGTQNASTSSAASARPDAMPAVRMGGIAQVMVVTETVSPSSRYWLRVSQRRLCAPVVRPSALLSSSIETVTR